MEGEREIIYPTLQTEARWWAKGILDIAGVDEAGRGPWAGPVYAAAVILPPGDGTLDAMEGVRDSKTLSARQRDALAERIYTEALAVAVGRATAAEVDARGIVAATRLAMSRALRSLARAPQALIIDALGLPAVNLPQEHFPYADKHCLSVAAAGIIAKVARDRWMVRVAERRFPGYGFAQHKGYGTPQHREALNRLGVCDIHRRSFRPIALRINGMVDVSEL